MKKDTVYLRHILESIGRIEENTADGREKFMMSHTLQDAVLRNLQTMSESTQRLSDDLKQKYPDIEWHSIAGFRNVLSMTILVLTLMSFGESFRTTCLS